MEKVIEVERLIKNHASVWAHYTHKEREEIAQELAKQIQQIENQYARSELYKRNYRCGEILYYISLWL